MLKKRDSKYELLRIISILLIIASHYSNYGNWYSQTRLTSFFDPFGKVGVDLFIMISGWFLSVEVFDLKKMIKRISKLWLWVIFYTWSILLIDYFIRFEKITLKSIIHNVFPMLFNEYWFVTSFLVLMFLVPLLNKMVKFLSQKQLIIYIFIFLVGSSILPLINHSNPPMEVNGVGIMITSYLSAAYLKKYDLKKTNNWILPLIMIVSLVLQYVLNKGHNGIMSFVIAFPIFVLFTKINSFYSNIVNFIASSVFASYLITENELIRIPLWHKWLNVGQYSDNPILPGILITICLICVTVLIDKIYKLCYGVFIVKFKEKLDNYIFPKFQE